MTIGITTAGWEYRKNGECPSTILRFAQDRHTQTLSAFVNGLKQKVFYPSTRYRSLRVNSVTTLRYFF